ncbi:MAG TPA: hypothetical protein VFC56_13635 [Stellaceae bacterium]|nr:hypothetical protein [Stellaceae bacterium]
MLVGLVLAIAGAAPASHAQYIPGGACPTHQWANGYGFTSGLACAQPSFGDLAGSANAGQVSGAFAGFVNKLRGNSLSQWYSGTAITITTSGGWASEGVYVVPTGASITASQVTSPQSGGPYYALKILGATANTDVKVRFPIESVDAASLAGQTVTFQITYQNKPGGSITPTLTTKYAGSQDSWGSPTTDLSAASMQSCANNAICTAAYTLAVNSGANNGYTPTVDFGALGSGGYVAIVSFDMRATAGLSTGANASPPTPELIAAALDATWCQRFFETSYDNGTAPGTATRNGIVMVFAYNSAAVVYEGISVAFQQTKRTVPSMNYWDGAGNVNNISYFQRGSWTDNNILSSSGNVGFVVGEKSFGIYTANIGPVALHFSADARITGA